MKKGTTIILQNGRLIDATCNRDETGELWLEDGLVVPARDTVPEDSLVFDLQGKWIVPGLIDMHVHLREPGEEYKETIESGTRAAAAGGFTAVACMPNTTPVNDCAAVTRLIMDTAASVGSCRVYPVAAISKGSEGSMLAEYGELKEAGAVAVTDDGLPVIDSQLMRRAMEYAGSHDLLVMSHSEEMALSRNGSMNEGVVSTRLGLRGIPVAAESIMVYREIALAELTGQATHIAHVSSEAATDLIAQAKKRGVPVTAETTPHYFTLTEEAVGDYNTNAKMNPPLRTEKDRQAIRSGLANGTFDTITTDHAPHSVLEKELEFDQAANGIIGLETSLALTMGLMRDGVIDALRLVELMSSAPARILKVAGGTLAVGSVADVVVIDPEREFIYTKESILSKGKNSPFIDWKLKGKAVLTVMGGRITHDELS
jgi:dihydroorotase